MAHQDLESVEFLDGAGAPIGDDPVPRPARRVPIRWIVGAALAAVLVLAGVGIVTRQHSPAATPSARIRGPVGEAPHEFIDDPQNLGVRYAHGVLVALSRTRFSYTESNGKFGSQPIRPLPDAPVVLLADPLGSSIVAVTVGTTPTRILQFAGPTAALVRDISWLVPVRSAALLGGQLVVTTPVGAYQLSTSMSTPEPIPGLTGAVGDVTADAARHRFVVADLGEPTEVWTFDGHQATQSANLLSVDNASLATVGDRLWIAGTWKGRAVLTMLDPDRLTLDLPTPEVARFGTSAQIVGTGDDVVWVRAPRSVETYCIDAVTGRSALQLIASGPMTSAHGLDAIVGGGQYFYARYRLRGCPG